MLTLSHVGVSFGATVLFSDINLQVNAGERIALAGRNGAGKTTLLNIIAGLNAPTEGSVALAKGAEIGYLPQYMMLNDERTVREEARKAFSKELELKATVDRLTEEVATRTDYDTEEYMVLIQQLANATELLSIYDTSRMEAEIEKTLKGLGFEQKDFDRPTREFSGGWRMRIELAKILLGRPDLLLLDEPTNHLDMESIVWLEDFLTTSPAAVIMVSHDRRFLDNATTRTVEISMGKAYDFKVNYSHYEELREERFEQQKRAYENQQKMIKDTEDFIERFRYKPTKSTQVQSRIKALEKIDPIEIDEIDRKTIHFRFPMSIPSGAYPLITKEMRVTYDGKRYVLDGIDLTIERGDKIALVGRNGSGKTTFVRAVLGEIPSEGSIKIGHQVITSYFAQNESSVLDPEKTIHDTIDDVAVGDIRSRINDILGAFMFGGETADKKVKVLSGGEKGRLAMIKLLLSPSNFLILDEPTNHLDMASKGVLKEAIANYDGTVLIVSHDRDFLEGLVDKVIEFEDGKVLSHLGGMEEYLRKLHDRNTEINQSVGKETDGEKKTTKGGGREDYEQQREQQRQISRLEKALAKAEEAVDQLETEKSSLEDRLTIQATPDLLNQYEEVDYKLKKAMKEWEKCAEELAAYSD